MVLNQWGSSDIKKSKAQKVVGQAKDEHGRGAEPLHFGGFAPVARDILPHGSGKEIAAGEGPKEAIKAAAPEKKRHIEVSRLAAQKGVVGHGFGDRPR